MRHKDCCSLLVIHGRLSQYYPNPCEDGCDCWCHKSKYAIPSEQEGENDN